MTREERLVRNIMGSCRGSIAVYAHAVEIIAHLLFSEHIAPDDIQVTKHVYPQVALRTGKSYPATARQLERMGNHCWNCLGHDDRLLYIGRQLNDIRAPSDMLFYLAFYSHYGKPYYEVIEEHPELLFQEGRPDR